MFLSKLNNDDDNDENYRVAPKSKPVSRIIIKSY